MEPFLKWVGGKRWLTHQQIGLFPDPSTIDRYFEPFLGGAAVFFHLQPRVGILSDINADLINCYQTIRDNWRPIENLLYQYQVLHSNDFYYYLRASEPNTPELRAARFLYLNRTCWNGLYRVNQNGEFNVPKGTKTKVLADEDDFAAMSMQLGDMDIIVSDFEATIDQAVQGNFVFIDPPYTVKHNLNGFLKYNEKIFSWEDQVRLRDTVQRGIQRGVRFLVLNANHQSVRRLYTGLGEMVTLDRASIIAGDARARGIFSELAIKCW